MTDLETAARGMLAMWDAVVAEAMNSSIRQDALDRIAELRAALERQTCECSHVPTKDPASCAIHDGAAKRRFRKKPVVIDAVRWTGSNVDEVLTLVDFDKLPSDCVRILTPSDGTLSVRTLEWTMTAMRGDWIIRGVLGEIYPCKPDMFASAYEADPIKGDGIIDDTEAIQAATDATTKPDAPQMIPREVEQIAYPQEHDRAERAIDLLMRLLQHAWVPENLACRCAFCQLVGDVNIFVREIDGKPEEES